MIEDTFKKIFGAAPEVVVRAPGRVNLIGEHTDYNDGFVLPAAIDRYIAFAGRQRPDRKVRAHSIDFQDSVEFSLDDIQKDAAHPWSNYLRGVSKFLESDGHQLAGADLVFGGDVPREAGLSSSAAVEVAATVFWQRLMGLELDPVYVIKLSRQAENEFVGMPCGIMDQFISALGRQDHALFLDCRDLTYRHVPLRGDVKVVVCNSGVKRALAQSEYEVRLKQCRQAVAQMATAGLAVKSLRDVEPSDLESARSALDELLLRRARHVVTENQRVLEAVKALAAGDLDIGERSGKVHRQRSVLVLALRDIQGQVVVDEIRLPREFLRNRREDLVAQAEVQGQLWRYLPVILGVEPPGELFRGDEVVGGDPAIVDITEQERGHIGARQRV
jgi:galactokinase